jgi:glycosyltransferase involved in cell wall biosynthesis
MAKALAKLDCQVTSVANCSEKRTIDGVDYRPLSSPLRWEGEVVILSTSGGKMDLQPYLDSDVNARLCIVWVHGVTKPGSLDQIDFDYIYSVSDFISNVICEQWGLSAERVITTRNSFEEELFSRAENTKLKRDPYKLIYFSHPSKGLALAKSILERLREIDPRYHLDVLGGAELWGETRLEVAPESGVYYAGLLGQEAVVQRLLQSTFSLQLQTREEPGPLAAVEAMRAGCVVMASDVGAYREYVEDGSSGFIFEGDPRNPNTQDEVVGKILELASKPDELRTIQLEARRSPQSNQEQASAWLQHWDSSFSC